MKPKSTALNVPAVPLPFTNEVDIESQMNSALSASAEEASGQHRQRTPLCPSLWDLAMLQLTEEQLRHAQFCEYCKKMLHVAREGLQAQRWISSLGDDSRKG